MYIMNQNRVEDMCILLNSLQAIHVSYSKWSRETVANHSSRLYRFPMNCARTNGGVELKIPTGVPERLR